MIRLEFTDGGHLDCAEINVIDYGTMICAERYVSLVDVERIYEVEENEEQEAYTPCATNRDYGPSNPWDAPGMSIHDFI